MDPLLGFLVRDDAASVHVLEPLLDALDDRSLACDVAGDRLAGEEGLCALRTPGESAELLLQFRRQPNGQRRAGHNVYGPLRSNVHILLHHLPKVRERESYLFQRGFPCGTPDRKSGAPGLGGSLLQSQPRTAAISHLSEQIGDLCRR